LTGEDRDELLCGRNDDKTRFRQAVEQHRLVFLSGKSGVGKSSLLDRGLIPQLTKVGFKVATCSKWSGVADEPDAAEMLAAMVRSALVGQITGLPEDQSIFRKLHEVYGARAVIILDQFEEMLRSASEEFKSKLFELISFLNHESPMRIVISMRSEFLHELRLLEIATKPFTVTHFYLDDIRPEYAEEVVNAGNIGTADAVKSTEAKSIAALWQLALTAHRTGRGVQRVGLLHLQALLYALHAVAEEGKITQTVLEDFVEKFSGTEGDDAERAAAVFDQAMQSCVNFKLKRCSEAAEDVGIDKWLIEGASDVLARLVPHLASDVSSGVGYKNSYDAFQLMEMTLGTDLQRLLRGIDRCRGERGGEKDGAPTAEQVRSLFDVIVAPVTVVPGTSANDEELDGRGSHAGWHVGDLFSGRDSLAERADNACEIEGAAGWVERLHPDAHPLAVDETEVTSSLMMGMAPASVLIEELRRYAFAIEWLQRISLVRLNRPGTDSVVVSLIHDSFGVALKLWSEEKLKSSFAPLRSLVAPAAGFFEWHPEEDKHFPAELDGDGDAEGARLLVNLRWRSAFIRARFRNVIFANCDVRGAFFDACEFEGVVFVNCLLEGLMFSDCVVIGTPAPPRGTANAATKFVIPRSERTADLLGKYRSGPIAGGVVLSSEPELPAIVATEDPDVRTIEGQAGGLVIQGGRIASLVIRNCAFKADWKTSGCDGSGVFSIRDTAGSGLDVVEHNERGNYEIIGSQLRHLSFTSPHDKEGGGDILTATADDSRLYDVWFGGDLQGSFTVTDSVIVSAWNGSPSMKAKLVQEEDGGGCTYHALVGFELEGEHEAAVPGERVLRVSDADPDGTLVRSAVATDYRRHPSDPAYQPPG